MLRVDSELKGCEPELMVSECDVVDLVVNLVLEVALVDLNVGPAVILAPEVPLNSLVACIHMCS